MMTRLPLSLLAASALSMVVGCGLLNSSANLDAPTEPVAEGARSTLPSAPTDDADTAASTPVPEDVQIYQDGDGMFALALPPDYTYEAVEQGLTFVSDDGGFAGEIVYQRDDSASSDVDKMAKQLRRTLEPKFQEIDWQKAGQRQPDGSVRLAWKGQDASDRTIDALSFIEHHDQHTFLLTLYAIDNAYNDYSEDARIIAGTYVVRRQEVVSESAAGPDDGTTNNTQDSAEAGGEAPSEPSASES